MPASDTLVILQARFASSRLPGKVLAPLDGVPLVAHCLRRLAASAVGAMCLATTTRPDDDAVAEVGRGMGVRVVRGAVDDVLGRFITATAEFEGRFVIRATADNPAVDLETPGRVLQCLAGGADYVVETGLPYGCAVEGIRLDAMRQAHHSTSDAYDREHVTPWVKARAEAFGIVTLPAPAGVARPDLRFTIDTPDDYTYMHDLLTAVGAGQRLVPLQEIIAMADHLAATGGAR